jgi:transcriptional regulator with XRE-family HTH domain
VSASVFGAALARARSLARLSQLALATRAGTTQRHVSFLERGRSSPGRGLVIRLAEALELPLRERNALLLTAGFAPVYAETPLGDPALRAVHDAMHKILMAHDPFPALMTDRVGTLLAGNDALGVLTEGVAAELLVPPVNVRRVALHPKGLAPRVLNFGDWGRHVVEMIRRELDRHPNPFEVELLRELDEYVEPVAGQSLAPDYLGLAMPLVLASPAGPLTLLTTVTSFSAAADVTIADMRLEAFLPADADTAARLEALRAARRLPETSTRVRSAKPGPGPRPGLGGGHAI